MVTQQLPQVRLYPRGWKNHLHLFATPVMSTGRACNTAGTEQAGAVQVELRKIAVRFGENQFLDLDVQQMVIEAMDAFGFSLPSANGVMSSSYFASAKPRLHIPYTQTDSEEE